MNYVTTIHNTYPLSKAQTCITPDTGDSLQTKLKQKYLFIDAGQKYYTAKILI